MEWNPIFDFDWFHTPSNLLGLRLILSLQTFTNRFLDLSSWMQYVANPSSILSRVGPLRCSTVSAGLAPATTCRQRSSRCFRANSRAPTRRQARGGARDEPTSKNMHTPYFTTPQGGRKPFWRTIVGAHSPAYLPLLFIARSASGGPEVASIPNRDL